LENPELERSAPNHPAKIGWGCGKRWQAVREVIHRVVGITVWKGVGRSLFCAFLILVDRLGARDAGTFAAAIRKNTLAVLVNILSPTSFFTIFQTL